MSTSSRLRRVAMLAAAMIVSACAGNVVVHAPEPATREALLILPGVGYSRHAQNVFRTTQTKLSAEGIDLYVVKFMERDHLIEGREDLREFIVEHGLERYKRLHVFAFIAGAWTLNPLLDSIAMPNLATIIYDRSPMQERAPRIADDKLHFLTWLRYGQPVFDLARTPYPALASKQPRIGILVETKPSGLIRRYRKTTLGYGPLNFECDSFGQRYDDCAFVAMSHDELYTKFIDVLPEITAFIKTGRFTGSANRKPPTTSPLPLTP